MWYTTDVPRVTEGYESIKRQLERPSPTNEKRKKATAMVNKDFEYRIDRIDYIGGKKSFDFLSEEFARLAANATTLTRFTASPAFLIMKGAKAEIF